MRGLTGPDIRSRLRPFEVKAIIGGHLALLIGDMPQAVVVGAQQCHVDGRAPVEFEHGNPETEGELRRRPLADALLCPIAEPPPFFRVLRDESQVILLDPDEIVLVDVCLAVGLSHHLGIRLQLKTVVTCLKHALGHRMVADGSNLGTCRMDGSFAQMFLCLLDKGSHPVLREVIHQKVLVAHELRQQPVGIVIVCPGALAYLTVGKKVVHDGLILVSTCAEIRSRVIEQHVGGIAHSAHLQPEFPLHHLILIFGDDAVDDLGMLKSFFHQLVFLVPVGGVAAVACCLLFRIAKTHPEHDGVQSVGQCLVGAQHQPDNCAINFHLIVCFRRLVFVCQLDRFSHLST